MQLTIDTSKQEVRCLLLGLPLLGLALLINPTASTPFVLLLLSAVCAGAAILCLVIAGISWVSGEDNSKLHTRWYEEGYDAGYDYGLRTNRQEDDA
jgi:hypothetical protein